MCTTLSRCKESSTDSWRVFAFTTINPRAMKACRSTSSHTDSSGAWERSGWEETTNAAGETLRRDTGLRPVRDAHRFQKDLASLLQERPARAGGPCHGEALRFPS